MFKRLLVTGGLLLSITTAAWAGAALDAIKARGTLRVGTTGDYKPFTFRDPDGSYRGADIEMGKRLASALGVKLEIVPTVWASMMDDFKAGKFDIAMGGVTILPARAAVGDFSDVTYVDGKRPIARCADADRFTDLNSIDQPDVRVVVNPGASNEQFARANFPHAKLTVHADNATVFDELVAKREDVMVTDGIEVDHQAMIHPELCATKVKAPFTRLEKAYWMVRDPDLLADVNALVRAEEANGDWDHILAAAQKQP